jgi:hypothetical protein
MDSNNQQWMSTPGMFLDAEGLSGTVKFEEWNPRTGAASLVFDHARLGHHAAQPCTIDGRVQTYGYVNGTRIRENR